MYHRFVCADQHPDIEAEGGFFWAYWTLADRPGAWKNRRLRRRLVALRDLARRFNELDTPCLCGPDRLRQGRRALFWFHADAAFAGRAPGTMIFAAREMAHVLGRAGIEIRELVTDAPGQVIWQEAGRQVLALPAPPMPRAFP